MTAFRDLSIKQKLVGGTMLASSSALLLAVIVFLVYEAVSLRETVVRNLAAQAEMIGLNSASAILFQDQRAATQVLSALSAERSITAAAIYASDHRLFASYLREGSQPGPPLPDLWAGPWDGSQFREQHLVLSRPIVFQGEALGAVVIQMSLEEMYQRIQRYVGIAAGILFVSFLVAYAISSRIQRAIAGPMLRLAETARVVSAERNYSVRAPAGNRDELGFLITTFNQMIEQIELRDKELQEARDKLEQRVKERTAELATAIQELEAFAYSVSHDLRAPLRHIDGFSRILLEDCGPRLDPQARGHLERIRQGASQMGLLIDDLLNLSRVARQQLSMQVTGLDSLVRDVLSDLRPDMEQRQIEWRIGRLPFVECDPTLMKQVFANLLSNAVKFTRPRERAVIEVGQTVHNGQPVVFVRDNGIGFSMKYADKLFGVFQRLHRPEDFEGAGVGLATVQRILHKHGGQVWAEAELDKGATFYFTLGTPAQESQTTPPQEVPSDPQ